MSAPSRNRRRLSLLLPRESELERLRAAARDRGLSTHRLVLETLADAGLIDATAPPKGPVPKHVRLTVEEFQRLRDLAGEAP